MVSQSCMKRSGISPFAILVSLPALLVVAFFLSLTEHGQSPETSKSLPDNKRLVKPTILIIDRGGKPTSNEAILSAATANAALSNESSGHLAQRSTAGILRGLSAACSELKKGRPRKDCLALARWQQTAGLVPTETSMKIR